MAAVRVVVLFALFSFLSVSLAINIGKDALEQCIETDAFGVSDDRIPDQSIIASSSMNNRPGSKGRLFGDSAWQAASNNYNQFLQVDLGQRRLITSVATQGYRGSGQFVIDYNIHYSNDNNTFVPIVDELNEARVFRGNDHDDKPQFNVFNYPIVARYVRFYPRRWNINIALRVELYGCDYEGKAAYFDGKSAIWFDAHTPNTLFTSVDLLRFRMRTSQSEGVVFYGAGNQGDHISLELSSGRLYVSINLGYLTWGKSGAEGVAGSLLDDDQWHDVELIRNLKNVTVSVDRVPVNLTIDGEFTRLDLDRFLYVGGVPTFYQSGITVRKNFTGCIENFVWNGIHMTRDKERAPRFGTSGDIGSSCSSSKFNTGQPITLSDATHHIEYTTADTSSNQLEFNLDFRTYDKDRLLLLHEATDFSLTVTITTVGHIEYLITSSSIEYTIKEAAKSDFNGGSYADGLWHRVQFKARQNSIILDIDNKAFITTRQLRFTAGNKFFIGGAPSSLTLGFIGCLRNIRVQQSALQNAPVVCGPQGNQDDTEYTSITTCVGDIGINTCGMEDRCRPNPCEHESTCEQTFFSFSCNCTDTGYQGATCHQPLYPVSCSRVFELRDKDKGQLATMIDIDGAGSLAPFRVTCRYNKASQMVETELEHDSQHEIMVDGKQDPGSYERLIKYNTDLTQMDQLIYRATSCKQSISYRCENSRLLVNPGIKSKNSAAGASEDGTGPDLGQVYKAWGWWIGRNNQNNYYWGGSTPGTHKCKCGLEGGCVDGEPLCNCDAGRAGPDRVLDSGFLTYKEHLPVLALRFGDTGSNDDAKKGWHKLGPLICAGDKLFDQPVTFRKQDAVIFFESFWTRESSELRTWDISFRFKTTAENGVIVHRVGDEDFIEIKIVTSTSMSFRFSAGYGDQAVVVDTAFTLNDDQWHIVYAERNRREAILQVDEFAPIRVPHPRGVGYLTFQFTSPLVVGASVDNKDGYVGCLSSLQVNGETLDLYDKVVNDERFSYGLTTGCTGRCEPNPCLNGGLCKEKYSDFICDCSYTPFRGLICGREVGVSIYDGQMVIYEPQGDLKTISENITLGFFTRTSGGVIMQLTDSLTNPNEYMVVEINSGGGIRVHFKFAANRLQVNTQIGNKIHFANGQQHIIQFRRTQGGKTIELQVDDYEPITSKDLSDLYPSGSDVYLENIKYVLLGRNGSDNTMFRGCIFRAEFQNHWPLKRLFQEPRPDYVSVEPSFESVQEERCGLEEILPEAEPIEVRPTYEPPIPTSVEKEISLEDQTEGQSAAYLGAIFGVVGIVLILVVSVVIYKCRNSGEYPESEEDENIELFEGQADAYDDYNPKSTSEKLSRQPSTSRAAFL